MKHQHHPLIGLEAVNEFFYKNRAFTLLVFGGVFAIASFLSTKIQFRKELLEILPPDQPTVVDYRTFLEHFSPLETMTIAIRADNPSDPQNTPELISAADQLALELTDSNLFSNITYDQSQEDLSGLLKVLYQHAGSYFDEAAADRAASHFTQDGLRQHLLHWRELLQTNPAPQLAQIFALDPLGISPQLAKRMEMFSSWASEFNLEYGRILSKDKTTALIFGQARLPASNGEFAEKLTGLLLEKQKDFRSKGWHLAFMGSHRFAYENAKQIKNDVESSSLISLIAIIVFAMLVFRRKILPLFAMVPILWGLAIASAICYLILGSISIVALACGSLLVGVAVDYGIHVLYHLDEQDVLSNENVRTTMHHLTKPLIATATISSLAFLCLLTSSLPVYREFCLFAVTGLVSSLIATLYLLPAFLSFLPTPKNHLQPIWDLTGFVTAVRLRTTPHFSQWATILGIFLTVVLGFGLSKLKIDADPQNLYSANREISNDAQEINHHLAGSMRTNSLIIRGADQNEAYKNNKILFDLLDQNREQIGIVGLQSVAPFIVGESEASDNVMRWKKFWTIERGVQLASIWKQIHRELQLKPDGDQRLLQQYQEAGVAIRFDDFSGTTLAKFLQRYIAKDGAPLLLTTFRLNDESQMKSVTHLLEENKIEFTLVNMQRVITEIIQLIYREFLLLGVVTGLSILTVLCFAFGPKQGWNMTGPLLLSLIWTFGMMGLCGVSVNILNSIVTLFVFGLVIDYSVFLFSSSEVHADRTLASIFMSGITTIFGVLALAFAEHLALKNIAFTVLIGVVMGLLSTTIWSTLVRRTKKQKAAS